MPDTRQNTNFALAHHTGAGQFSHNETGGIRLFAGGTSGVFLSTNNGSTWTSANSGITSGTVTALLAVPTSSNSTHLYAGTYGDVFLSTNNGTSWMGVNDGWRAVVRAFVALPNRPDGYSLFVGTDGYGIYRSTSNGASWTTANNGLTSSSVLALAAKDSNLFAGTIGGAFLSTNNGTSWTPVNSGLTFTDVFALSVSPDSSGTLFVGTRYGGVWKRPLSEMITGIDDAKVKPPENLSLHQNYPNPFNPSTTIRYALPHSSHVTLTVYNTLGQQVAQLVNEQQQAGYHDAVFRDGGLASGVYFYRLEAGGYVSVKKLLLLK